MKLYDLLELRRIFASHMDDGLPAILSYKLYKMIKRSDEEEKFYVQELNKIIQEYAERDEAGDIITVNDSVKMSETKKEQWKEKLNELQNIEIDYSISFSLSELEPFSFSISDMTVLGNYILEETTNGRNSKIN